MAMGTIHAYTAVRAADPRIGDLVGEALAIPDLMERRKALAETMKKHGSKRVQSFYLVSPSGVPVRVSASDARLIRDLREATVEEATTESV